jgi:hypothetical protein
MSQTSVAKSKTPRADKGPASLVFFYFGDSKYETMGQETMKLRKAMEGYEYSVLLKHDDLPGWADLSEADERLANVKAIPTKANLFKQIIDLADKGHFIDIYLFTHGNTETFKASAGKPGSSDWVTKADLLRELGEAGSGYARLPIRTVWGVNCYGASLGSTWRDLGAKVTAGARYVNFYPNSYGRFIDDWNKGDVSFEDAVSGSDTDLVRTVAQTYIRFVDAPRTEKAGLWGGCGLLNTVLGDSPCAREYFDKRWLGDGEWRDGLSGKENMNIASYMIVGGERDLTKKSRPRW